jgi:hypothetical protein
MLDKTTEPRRPEGIPASGLDFTPLDYPRVQIKPRGGKHRASDRPIDSYFADAACTRPPNRGLLCRTGKCPRHNPDNYAESMARHATDSF